MRTKLSYLNVVTNFIIILIQTVGLFVTRTFFIKVLGEEYLGLDGLYTNILSMLALAELGVGTAVSYSLFAPLSKKNYEQVEKIMNYLRICYHKIALIILMIGLSITPFLGFFVKGYSNQNINIYIIFLIYLIDVVTGYSLIYKEALLTADQQKHKIAIYNIFFSIIQYIIQIMVLIFIKSFILYLLVQIIVKFLQRVVINKYITKYYKNIKFDGKNKLNKSEIKEIKSNISGL